MNEARQYLIDHPNCEGLWFIENDSWHFVNHGSHKEGSFMTRKEILGDEDPKIDEGNSKKTKKK